MPRRLIALACAATPAVAACVLPSDQTEDVLVTIEAPNTLLLRGRTLVLAARAWEREPNGLREIPGVAFDWKSLRPDLATVDERPDGTALVTPLNEGTVEVEAVAAAFEQAEPGVVSLRVANALAIDSVRPLTVRYGEQVTLFGVGLGEITRASLGEADLIPDAISFAGTQQGLGRLSFWVPYPAGTDRLVAVSRRGSTAVAPETTLVRTQDLYHELQTPPPRLDLDGSAVRGTDTLFHNPALAAVPGEGTDAFQLHQEQPGRSLTIILTSTTPVVSSFDPVLTAEREVPDDFPSSSPLESWALGFSGHHCREGFLPVGRPVPPTAPVVLVRALKDLPPGDLLLAVYGDPPGRYALTVRDGYITADPRIGADRFEEDDYCAAADSVFADPDRRVELPFSDTLTIDNPFDVDWLRFRLFGDPEEPDVLVTMRVAARPFAASDSSDIGILVTSPDLDVFSSSRTAGSSETITAELSPGNDYYLVVVDDRGVPTRYSVCLALGPTCRLFEEVAATGR